MGMRKAALLVFDAPNKAMNDSQNLTMLQKVHQGTEPRFENDRHD
jgi:hypothetical protein